MRTVANTGTSFSNFVETRSSAVMNAWAPYENCVAPNSTESGKAEFSTHMSYMHMKWAGSPLHPNKAIPPTLRTFICV